MDSKELPEGVKRGCPSCKLQGMFEPVGMHIAAMGSDKITGQPIKALVITQILCNNCGELMSVITDLNIPTPSAPKGVVKPTGGVPGIGTKN